MGYGSSSFLFYEVNYGHFEGYIVNNKSIISKKKKNIIIFWYLLDKIYLIYIAIESYYYNQQSR